MKRWKVRNVSHTDKSIWSSGTRSRGPPEKGEKQEYDDNQCKLYFAFLHVIAYPDKTIKENFKGKCDVQITIVKLKIYLDNLSYRHLFRVLTWT
jgi:hypothetical protein